MQDTHIGRNNRKTLVRVMCKDKSARIFGEFDDGVVLQLDLGVRQIPG